VDDSVDDDRWDRMAAMVRQEITKGETVPLDEVFPSQKWNQVSPKHFVSVWTIYLHLFKSKLQKPTHSGKKIPTILAFSLNESASDNRFTLSVLALTTVFSAYWNLTIFTDIGLAHMMSMMNCLIGCSFDR
jgi:hypothetical protein